MNTSNFLVSQKQAPPYSDLVVRPTYVFPQVASEIPEELKIGIAKVQEMHEVDVKKTGGKRAALGNQAAPSAPAAANGAKAAAAAPVVRLEEPLADHPSLHGSIPIVLQAPLSGDHGTRLQR